MKMNWILTGFMLSLLAVPTKAQSPVAFGGHYADTLQGDFLVSGQKAQEIDVFLTDGVLVINQAGKTVDYAALSTWVEDGKWLVRTLDSTRVSVQKGVYQVRCQMGTFVTRRPGVLARLVATETRSVAWRELGVITLRIPKSPSGLTLKAPMEAQVQYVADLVAGGLADSVAQVTGRPKGPIAVLARSDPRAENMLGEYRFDVQSGIEQLFMAPFFDEELVTDVNRWAEAALVHELAHYFQSRFGREIDSLWRRSGVAPITIGSDLTGGGQASASKITKATRALLEQQAEAFAQGWMFLSHTSGGMDTVKATRYLDDVEGRTPGVRLWIGVLLTHPLWQNHPIKKGAAGISAPEVVPTWEWSEVAKRAGLGPYYWTKSSAVANKG